MLWRWIGTHAPDLVLDRGRRRRARRGAFTEQRCRDRTDSGAARVAAGTPILESLVGPSRLDAHQELDRRSARSPRALAEQLAQRIRSRIHQPTYIAAMALIGRLRLGEQADVTAAAGALSRRAADSFARPSQSSLAAHMLFFEVAQRLGDERAQRLVVRAASSGFTDTGELREFMPLHGGWSDSLFMDVPILAKAGALTGDRRYFDMAARHMAFMQQIVLRPDGLYRHQASADAAWGRGNAFAGTRTGADALGVPDGSPGVCRGCSRRSSST